MGKIYKLAAIVCISIWLLFTACAGASDWTSVKLAGDYAVVRSNTEHTELCLMDTEDMTVGTPVVGPMVIRVAYNEDYILAECKKPVRKIRQWRNWFQRYYYIVEIKSESVTGPYTEEELEEACSLMEISELAWKSVESLERAEI